MGYKILDVKADIHEDIEKYFQSIAGGYAKASQGVEEDILDIIDKHFEEIER